MEPFSIIAIVALSLLGAMIGQKITKAWKKYKLKQEINKHKNDSHEDSETKTVTKEETKFKYKPDKKETKTKEKTKDKKEDKELSTLKHEDKKEELKKTEDKKHSKDVEHKLKISSSTLALPEDNSANASDTDSVCALADDLDQDLEASDIEEYFDMIPAIIISQVDKAGNNQADITYRHASKAPSKLTAKNLEQHNIMLNKNIAIPAAILEMLRENGGEFSITNTKTVTTHASYNIEEATDNVNIEEVEESGEETTTERGVSGKVLEHFLDHA